MSRTMEGSRIRLRGAELNGGNLILGTDAELVMKK
jgi:hypothetical protein